MSCSALRIRQILSRSRCGRKCRTTKLGWSGEKLMARRRLQKMARSSSEACQGSQCGWAERSRHSGAPRLRLLRTVLALMPWRRATMPLGSLERAISARVVEVMRGSGWICDTGRPCPGPAGKCRNRQAYSTMANPTGSRRYCVAGHEKSTAGSLAGMSCLTEGGVHSTGRTGVAGRV